MPAFHYPLPEARPPSSWHGLSDEARASLTPTVTMGPSAANQLLTNGDGAEGLSPEVQSWASAELNNNFIDGALDSWQRYEAELGSTVPRNVDELLQTNPNLAPTLTRLHEAKQALIVSGEITPEGLNVGETMRLLVMPWQAISDNRANLGDWVNRMRAIQGIRTGDYINNDLLAIIVGDQPLYRDAGNPSRLRTSSDYLARKIEQDGPWGVILTQISDQAGLKRIVESSDEQCSPDAMTNNGTGHFEVAGQAVDDMGIFEWLGLTLQEDPAKLSTQDYYWMLANRVEVSGAQRVPYGGGWCAGWYGSQVKSDLSWANDQDGNVQVRLTVM
jgi:hypothetical protein